MSRRHSIRTFFVAVLATAVFGGAGYYYFSAQQERAFSKDEKSELELSLRFVRASLKREREKSRELSTNLADERTTNSNLAQNLEAEQARNNQYNDQLKNISVQVDTLQKLSDTDRELLKKYSKVYFLSENYVPSKLSLVNAKYLWNPNKLEQFHTDALSFLIGMLDEASSSVGSLQIVSAYRSFYDQMSVKAGYKILYGSGANQFSADQGYSEHQLGTTVDFTIPKLAGPSLQFEKQSEYLWLAGNAHRFGFVLSYPRNNSYYQFEPWHWRFVGIALARKLHDEGKYFYDLPQREIDTYLISIFDR